MIVYVEDGDQISIIAKLEPSINDPAGEYPGVGQTYRVVANSFGPTFKLVSLKKEPTLLRELKENVLETNKENG